MIDDKPNFVKVGENKRNILKSKYKTRKAHDEHLKKYEQEYSECNPLTSNQNEEIDKEYQDLFNVAHEIAMAIRKSKAKGIEEENKEIEKDIKEEEE